MIVNWSPGNGFGFKCVRLLTSVSFFRCCFAIISDGWNSLVRWRVRSWTCSTLEPIHYVNKFIVTWLSFPLRASNWNVRKMSNVTDDFKGRLINIYFPIKLNDYFMVLKIWWFKELHFSWANLSFDWNNLYGLNVAFR